MALLGAAAALLLAAAAAPPVARVDGRYLSFVSDAFKDALTTCREAGGKLVPAPAPAVWRLDVNDDGRPEYLFELGANVNCEGAPSIFDCGSLGCPLGLYQEHEGTWRAIGSIGLVTPESIELMPPRPGTPYRELRVGCVGDAPCAEFAHYKWTERGYELSRYQVRGSWVEVGASAGRLRGVTREIAVRATPAASAAVLDRYPPTSEVVVLGDASGTPYVYVSPCNACASGFIERSALR